ncbi:hypothetical protein V0288_04580 [Pannus brasiliensis CCIBt3594]|uniref:Uncharacterized protein n=1 Tax=Pannus brasiliensis CCIBt3594 TaxID=1427578 RepID=A0AAW9QQU6_9CHRO
MTVLSSSEWVRYHEKCTARAKHGKLARLSAGFYYTRSPKGHLLKIFQIDEGYYEGWWLVESANIYAYSDPVATLREAKEIAWNWD